MYIAMIKLCLNLHVELPFVYADTRYLVKIPWCIVNLNLWKHLVRTQVDSPNEEVVVECSIEKIVLVDRRYIGTGVIAWERIRLKGSSPYI